MPLGRCLSHPPWVLKPHLEPSLCMDTLFNVWAHDPILGCPFHVEAIFTGSESTSTLGCSHMQCPLHPLGPAAQAEHAPALTSSSPSLYSDTLLRFQHPLPCHHSQPIPCGHPLDPACSSAPRTSPLTPPDCRPSSPSTCQAAIFHECAHLWTPKCYCRSLAVFTLGQTPTSTSSNGFRHMLVTKKGNDPGDVNEKTLEPVVGRQTEATSLMVIRWLQQFRASHPDL
ncbi:uncharacterized protein [Manis javanica]|uniref:uncharacterized protein isoform X2 n=1 Tax=Manis javanica TaxID=9974 RepID=UPI003C6D4584